MVKWKVAQQAKSCSPIITAAAYIIFFLHFRYEKNARYSIELSSGASHETF